MPKRRLDSLLAERGLFSSRTRAAASVMAGEVRVGADGRRAAKPGELVDAEEQLSVEQPPRYVSRGGTKLANALDSSGIEASGRRAIDVGAATGGFTDCLLQRGASEVIAVDVGYGALAWRLRGDPRVHVMERTNARTLSPAALPYRPELGAVDVSFISLAKVLQAVLACMAERASTCWRWSSPSSRSDGRGWARAAWCAARATAARRSCRWAKRRARWGRPCSGTTPRACPGPRATARRLCGSRSARAPVQISRRWRTWPAR